MEEVPRRTSLVPLAFPCFAQYLIGVETEGLLDYQLRAGIMSIVRWCLRPVIFGVENSTPWEVGPRVATPLASYRIGFGPPARNRKKEEKYRKRPPPENRSKIAAK